jgi:hypothetical protein
MLESIVRRSAPDALSVEPQSAVFVGGGTHAAGEAEVVVSRSSIAIRFRRPGELVVEKAAYGEASGTVTATRDAWFSAEVNDAGKAANGDQLFAARAIRIGMAVPASEIAATRLVVAGDAWQGSGAIGDRHFAVAPLCADVVSHHDRRLAIAIEGSIDEATIEAIGRACAFVAGMEVEILRVERYSGDGLLVDVEYRRGFRRVGRAPHSPFTRVGSEDRTRAWAALVEAFPRLLADGVPIDMIVDQLSAHNQVSQIHVSSVLLLLATQTAAYQRLHGAAVQVRGTSGRPELEKLSRDLGLGLTDDEIARFERLKIELFDAGFFHAPGYETGRPQRDIKFLRDLAHVAVLRMCGYTGPFYGAERFVVRELAASST